MSTTEELFIRQEDRPDIRAAMTDNEEQSFDWQAISSPIHYLPSMKDCSGDKGDKSDKNKEVGKDDKNARNAAGSPSGPVTDSLAHRLWSENGDAADLQDAIDSTVFS